MKKIITLTVITTLLLFLTSCIFFQNVNQPTSAAPNEIVTVTLIASTQGGSYEPYFGVCLPIGWIIPGDSVQCGGTYEEAIHYDTLVASDQESVSPAPTGYYWWAGRGIPDESAVGTVFANLKIKPDNQLGVFSIDYMLGDGFYGLNYERSNGHLIEITNTPLILYVNPEVGYQNFSLDMNILGLNTHFSDGTGTDNVWLSKNSDKISANSFSVNSNTSIDANFSIPLNAETGMWDINVDTDIDGIVTKLERFNILPSPPLIIVRPDSLVVELLPGTTRTMTITVGNEGKGNLNFNIVGAFSSTNYALEFDGVDDVVIGPTTEFPVGNSNRTIEMWFKRFSILSVESHLMGYGDWGNPGNNFGISIKSDQWYHGFFCSNWGDAIIGSTTIQNNQWYHGAAVTDGTDIVVYLNGEVDAIGSMSLSTLENTPFYIGRTADGYDKPRKFNGIIDEVRIWDVPRSQQEIQQYLNKSLTGTEPGLVGYWKFDEGKGIITIDNTINANNDGTLQGGVSWVNSTAPMELDWLSMNCDSGLCRPNSSMNIDLLFDATEVDTGEYHASIIVKSNDPFTPTVIVPINMIASSTVDVLKGLNTPMVFKLAQNFPNPFNPTTKISYALPQNSFVELKVFNLLGQEIATLVNQEKPAGTYEVNFDARSAAGGLPSGVYIYKMKAGEFVETLKMILLK